MSDIYHMQRSVQRLATAPFVQPKIPAVDHYDLDDGDATHPIYIDFLLPSAAATFCGAKLSWKMRSFRSTSQFSVSGVNSDSTGESGHNHSHGHSLHVANNAGGANANFAGAGLGLGDSLGGAPFDTAQVVNADASGSSGHSHNHAHTLSGSGSQGVTDGPAATVIGVAIDGVDVTAALGGPWAGDVVEMDISSVMPLTVGVWHTIQLSLSGLGRLVSMLRLYYA